MTISLTPVLIGTLCAVVYVAALSALTDQIFATYVESQEFKFYEPIITVVLLFLVISAVLALNNKLIKNNSEYSRHYKKATRAIAISMLYLGFGAAAGLGIVWSNYRTVDLGWVDLVLIAYGLFAVVTLFLGKKVGWYSAVTLILVSTLMLAGYINIGNPIGYPDEWLLAWVILDVLFMTVLTLPGVLNYCKIPTNAFARPLEKIG